MSTTFKVSFSILVISIIGVILIVKTSHCNKNITENTDLFASDSTAIKKVHNLIILDESGSMYGLERVSINGVNETIQTIKDTHHSNSDQEQLLTLVTFSKQMNTRVVYHYSSHKIDDVEKLSIYNFKPKGTTPLWDVIGRMCTSLESDIDVETLVLVTIITDGLENASTEYNRESIKNLITRLSDTGWVFTYIGANQNALFEANSIGIKNALQYNSSEIGTEEMWRKENDSRQKFYKRSQTVISRVQLQKGYFNDSSDE